jgi:acyl-[acyl carrier protein]--UDP-N-acetylglucosamine O-acyltransferase
MIRLCTCSNLTGLAEITDNDDIGLRNQASFAGHKKIQDYVFFGSIVPLGALIHALDIASLQMNASTSDMM